MTSVKDIKKLLCKNIKLLSIKYKSALKNGGAGANEWLRDNYYLLSREGENAFCELDKFKHLTVLHCSGDGVNENPPSLRIASEKSVHDGYPLRWGRGQSSPSNTSLDCRTSFAMTGVGSGVIPAF